MYKRNLSNVHPLVKVVIDKGKVKGNELVKEAVFLGLEPTTIGRLSRSLKIKWAEDIGCWVPGVRAYDEL